MGPALVAMFKAERERQEAYQRALLGRDDKVRELSSLLPKDALVFPYDPTTAEGLALPQPPERMRDRFAHAAVRAGLKADNMKTSPHGLRHTAISHAIEGGVGLADVAARAGHSSVQTTSQTYVHSISESQRKAATVGDNAPLLTVRTWNSCRTRRRRTAAISDRTE